MRGTRAWQCTSGWVSSPEAGANKLRIAAEQVVVCILSCIITITIPTQES